MPYRLTSSADLTRAVERVRGVLSVHLEAGEEYTVEELLGMLRDRGLHYTDAEYQEIGQQLIQDGFIEQV